MMSKILLVLMFVVLVAGCANDPSFSTGKVINKYYQPERDWTALEYSSDCGLGIDGTYSCGALKLKMVHHHQYEEHQLEIENCNIPDKNGNTIVKKDGSQKCYRKWIDVDADTYSRYHVGDDYEVI